MAGPAQGCVEAGVLHSRYRTGHAQDDTCHGTAWLDALAIKVDVHPGLRATQGTRTKSFRRVRPTEG